MNHFRGDTYRELQVPVLSEQHSHLWGIWIDCCQTREIGDACGELGRTAKWLDEGVTVHACGVNAHTKRANLRHGLTSDSCSPLRSPRSLLSSCFKWLTFIRNSTISACFALHLQGAIKMDRNSDRHRNSPEGGGCMMMWKCPSIGTVGKILDSLSTGNS
jgi:hypothetical protein